MLIPETIIVANCREKVASSAALTLLVKPSSMLREECLSAMSRTISPRCLSWSETACLESASTSPRALPPVRPIALKTYVLMPGLRGRQRARPQQAPELIRRRGACFSELLGDLFPAHERGQSG